MSKKEKSPEDPYKVLGKILRRKTPGTEGGGEQPRKER